MPWLIKDKKEPDENILFVHVPRCGGTSLTKHFNIPKKSREGRNLWHRCGMMYFFYRYRLLEGANFPIVSYENLIALLFIITSILLFAFVPFYTTRECKKDTCPPGIAAYTFLISGVNMFLFSTFFMSAPVIGRWRWARRLYAILNHYLLCRLIESIPYICGGNITGFLVHTTAPKMLQYKYVQAERMREVSSFAIVRNPYSRMVSIYMYNRFGSCEDFHTFCKRWVRQLKDYRATGRLDEWYIYCHAIPMFEYTHFKGKQLVQCIIKQEELKFLFHPGVTKHRVEVDESLTMIPKPIQEALRGMPHSNQRKRAQPWWDYFNQEDLNITYDLYKEDFKVFGYSPVLDKRPDLKPPPGSENTVATSGIDVMRRNSEASVMLLNMASNRKLDVMDNIDEGDEVAVMSRNNKETAPDDIENQSAKLDSVSEEPQPVSEDPQPSSMETDPKAARDSEQTFDDAEAGKGPPTVVAGDVDEEATTGDGGDAPTAPDSAGNQLQNT